MKFSIGKKIAAFAVAGVVLVGAGTVAFAQTSPGPTTTAPAASATTPGKATGKAMGQGLALLKRADHGDIEVKVKGGTWKTVTFDRGQVGAVAADQITLARPDGKSVTLTINAATKFRGVTSWQQVTKAQGAVVVSDNGTATLIVQKPARA
jgi:hypothetical protein